MKQWLLEGPRTLTFFSLHDLHLNFPRLALLFGLDAEGSGEACIFISKGSEGYGLYMLKATELPLSDLSALRTRPSDKYDERNQ